MPNSFYTMLKLLTSSDAKLRKKINKHLCLTDNVLNKNITDTFISLNRETTWALLTLFQTLAFNLFILLFSPTLLMLVLLSYCNVTDKI